MTVGYDRRSFLQSAVALGTTPLLSGPAKSKDRRTPRLGLCLAVDREPGAMLARARELGFSLVQICTEDLDAAAGTELAEAIKRHRLEIASLLTLGPGPRRWDFYGGPLTSGLVPREYRRQRIDHLKAVSDTAKRLGIASLGTYVGYIPEDPNDVLYAETVEAAREVVSHCRGNGQIFLYHAGQETPTTLLRTIQDVGLDNQGVSLDTANSIIYDKGHPLAAVEIYGDFLRAVNAQDGNYPTNPREPGRTVPIGRGMVGFPRLVARLREFEFKGPILIKRGISAPRLVRDVQKAKTFLERLLQSDSA